MDNPASPLASEREGEAVAQVRSTLKLAAYSATQLCLSMRIAIAGPLADIPLPLAVEKAVEGVSARELKSMSSSLLKYHAITNNYPEAAKFLRRHGKETVSEYLSVMLVRLLRIRIIRRHDRR